MGFFERLKKKPPTIDLTAEQRGPTVIRHSGITVSLPFKWELVQEGDPQPGAVEYRNTVLAEQLFVIPRPFSERVPEATLRELVERLAGHVRSALIESNPSAKVTPIDIRSGNGQSEARMYAHAKEFQAAFLQRADVGRAVSVSLYRYLDKSKLDLAPVAESIFDLVQFERTA